MKNISKFISFLLLVNNIYAGAVTVSDNEYNTYIKNGEDIIKMAMKKKASENEIKGKIEEMVNIAKKIATQYKSKFTTGEVFLSTVIGKVDTMKSLSFKEVNDQWHDLNYFRNGEGKGKAGFDIDDEDNEHFSDPAHVIIHPILALLAAKNKDFDSIKEELSEGIEQVKNIKNKMN